MSGPYKKNSYKSRSRSTVNGAAAVLWRWEQTPALQPIGDDGRFLTGRPVPTNSAISGFIGTFKRFTNKAAGEMRERVDNLIGMGAEQIWVATFHATCVRILRRYIERLGYDNNFTIYDTDDQKTLMKGIIKKLELDPKMFKERSLLSAISSAKDELISPIEYELQAGGDFFKKKVAAVYREYQAALKKNNALDFDDLIVKTVELFKADAEVLHYYQERFKYSMVDE